MSSDDSDSDFYEKASKKEVEEKEEAKKLVRTWPPAVEAKMEDVLFQKMLLAGPHGSKDVHKRVRSMDVDSSGKYLVVLSKVVEIFDCDNQFRFLQRLDKEPRANGYDMLESVSFSPSYRQQQQGQQQPVFTSSSASSYPYALRLAFLGSGGKHLHVYRKVADEEEAIEACRKEKEEEEFMPEAEKSKSTRIFPKSHEDCHFILENNFFMGEAATSLELKFHPGSVPGIVGISCSTPRAFMLLNIFKSGRDDGGAVLLNLKHEDWTNCFCYLGDNFVATSTYGQKDLSVFPLWDDNLERNTYQLGTARKNLTSKDGDPVTKKIFCAKNIHDDNIVNCTAVLTEKITAPEDRLKLLQQTKVQSAVNSVSDGAWRDYTVVSASWKRTVRMTNFGTGISVEIDKEFTHRPLHLSTSYSNHIYNVKLLPGNPRYCVSGTNNSASFWDIQERKLLVQGFDQISASAAEARCVPQEEKAPFLVETVHATCWHPFRPIVFLGGDGGIWLAAKSPVNRWESVKKVFLIEMRGKGRIQDLFASEYVPKVLTAKYVGW